MTTVDLNQRQPLWMVYRYERATGLSAGAYKTLYDSQEEALAAIKELKAAEPEYDYFTQEF